MVTKNLRIYGRVQGVAYRAWTAQTAQHMRLTGWVRNRQDGSVEALVTGDEKNVEKFVKACYEGPPMAQVEMINVATGFDENLKTFEIRETL